MINIRNYILESFRGDLHKILSPFMSSTELTLWDSYIKDKRKLRLVMLGDKLRKNKEYQQNLQKALHSMGYSNNIELYRDPLDKSFIESKDYMNGFMVGRINSGEESIKIPLRNVIAHGDSRDKELIVLK